MNIHMVRVLHCCQIDAMSFREARLFRRTGRFSYSVQLQGSPGVVEIHCTEVNWGHLDACEDSSRRLQDRLVYLGTAGMFVPGARNECKYNPIGHGAERLLVEVGPYEPSLKAFVQCRMKVLVDDSHNESEEDLHRICSQLQVSSNCDQLSNNDREPMLPPLASRKPRKPFKWFFRGGGSCDVV